MAFKLTTVIIYQCQKVNMLPMNSLILIIIFF